MSATKEFLLASSEARIIFGKQDENLIFLEELMDVQLFGRGSHIKAKGAKKQIEKFHDVLEKLRIHVQKHNSLNKTEIALYAQENTHEKTTGHKNKKTIQINSKKDVVLPKSVKQTTYIKAVQKYDMVISIGPAGTGKTYLAVAMGIEAIKNGEYQKLIVSRPALEAGEKLGFLPGALKDKIKPYLQPVYDALFDLLQYEEIKQWTQKKIIEIIPLAYMRGRTLSDAFVILDEAQNTTFEQMKMFLTRLGTNSKAIITGDVTQIDAPLGPKTSGLVEIQQVLKQIPGIKFVSFSKQDIVRHQLVKKIINAYEKYYKKQNRKNNHPEPAEKK